MKRAALLLVLGSITCAPAAAAGRGGPLVLVTAERANQVVAVQGGRVVGRLDVPADPQNVEAEAGEAVVVSTGAGAVSFVDPSSLRITRTIRGFAAPHIAAFAPSGDRVYVTDDARGQLAVIRGRVVAKVFVGYGAHHMAFDPTQRRLWIALGERARSIAVVDTEHPDRPRLIGHIRPLGLAHDLAFAPDGRTVWVTYDDRPYARIFDVRTGRPIARVFAGSPPAHVRFDDADGLPRYARYAYVASGNSGRVRIFDWRRRRLVETLRTPPGSFNLSVDHGRIATASLTSGIVTSFGGGQRTSLRVSTAARDAAIATP